MASETRSCFVSSSRNGEKRRISGDEKPAEAIDVPELLPGSYTLLKALLRRSVADPLWRRRAATSPPAVSKLLAFGASLLHVLARSQEELRRRRKRAVRERTSEASERAPLALPAEDARPSDSCSQAEVEPSSPGRNAACPSLHDPSTLHSPLALLGELSVLFRLLRNLCVEGRDAQDVILSLGGAELFLSNLHVLIEALSHAPPDCRCFTSEGGGEEASAAVRADASPERISEREQGRRGTPRPGDSQSRRLQASQLSSTQTGSQQYGANKDGADVQAGGVCVHARLECETDGTGVTASLLQFLSNLSVRNDRARVFVQQKVLYVPLLLLALASPSVAPAFMLLNTLFKGESSEEQETGNKRGVALDAQMPGGGEASKGDAAGQNGPWDCERETDKPESRGHTDHQVGLHTEEKRFCSGRGDDRFFEFLGALYILAANEDASHLATVQSNGPGQERQHGELDGHQTRLEATRAPLQGNQREADARTTSLHAQKADQHISTKHLEWPMLFVLQLLNRESDGRFFFRFLESLQANFSIDTLERFAVLLLAPPRPAEQKVGKTAVERCLNLHRPETGKGPSLSQLSAEDDLQKLETTGEKYDEIQAFCDRPCRAVYLQKAVSKKLSGVGQSGLLQFLLVLFDALLDDTGEDESTLDKLSGAGANGTYSPKPMTLRMKLSASAAFYAFMNGQIRRAVEAGERLRDCGRLLTEKWAQDGGGRETLGHVKTEDGAQRGRRPDVEPALDQGRAGPIASRAVEGLAGNSLGNGDVRTGETFAIGPPFDILSFASKVTHSVHSLETQRRRPGFTESSDRNEGGAPESEAHPAGVHKRDGEGLLPPKPSARPAEAAEEGDGVTVIEGSRSAKDLFKSASSVPHWVRVADTFLLMENILLGVCAARAEALEARRQGERRERECGVTRATQADSHQHLESGKRTSHEELAEDRGEMQSHADDSVEAKAEALADAIVLLLRLSQQQRLLAFLYCSEKNGARTQCTASREAGEASETLDGLHATAPGRGQHAPRSQNNSSTAYRETSEPAVAEEVEVKPQEGDVMIWGLLQRSVKSGVLLRALANLLVDSPRTQQVALHAQALPLLASFVHTNEEDPFTREAAVFLLPKMGTLSSEP
ncbi:conserved hypothetical protein [Neospora caninum Liverpool]|uniref:Uncharacterized protein n=1 Tax=Neospora caninum (strain Liverpool) TaxID=572307 RepID=F0VPS1_NEOCL|nr:conserved hypothetical protein [Neospora caninum Liverpool]CBZ55718.1 conserved hypothetical protein [Neospora caninum Liverpool]|eukprot:XP_003885744.1 conserved hypothetical protein [Neospora caninum Liverpool]